MKRREPSLPDPAMIKAVDEMFRHLEQIASDPAIVGRCPDLPGIVLDKVTVSCLERSGLEYEAINREYNALRSDYLKALAAHPTGRALALLAVGPSGLEMMEQGRIPDPVLELHQVQGAPLRPRRASYNCHHVIPKSVRPAHSDLSINHPSNFVIAKTTRRGRDQSQNPHHCWHSLFLHPQTHNAPAHPIPLYVVRPLFPFYPPVAQGFRSAEELRTKLHSLGVPQLPEIWERRILEFSKATRHQPYVVPKEFHQITRMFGDLYKAENKEPAFNQLLRTTLAEQGAALAAQYLPAGAYVNGKALPDDHKPKKLIPIVESKSVAQTIAQPAPATEQKKSPRLHRSPQTRITPSKQRAKI